MQKVRVRYHRDKERDQDQEASSMLPLRQSPERV